MSPDRPDDDHPADDAFAQARRSMVREQLQARGLRHARVLEVMGRVPREHFVSGSRARSPWSVYADSAVPVGRGQTLSQPYMVARMTADLDPQPGSRILEIGTGTGYQTAVLAALAEEVWTVERDPVLAEGARERLEALGIENVHFRYGDGSLGWPEGAPFDGILVTAGAPRIPAPLVGQLAEDGRMVIPVGPPDLQELLLVEVRGGEVRSRVLTECRFVPLVGEAGWASPPA
ncbi:MAG: protein-L-isoaspartate(D-aspartate) O-methyltransferase [Gemmatimonadales bacterium]|nr:MAG: protein-L-isoaspartate(D-aspartate) O-methyltransferase [Gemmatimonadales bacterium]